MKQADQQPEPSDEFESFDKVYTDINSAGSVWRHKRVLDTVDDYPEVYEIATDMAKKGCLVKILPILNEKDAEREVVFAGAKQRKCPDMTIDGVFTDVKTLHGNISNNCIDNNIKKAYKQANSVVIRVPGELSYTRLKFLAKNRFDRHASLEQIEFKLIGTLKYYCFKRADFED